MATQQQTRATSQLEILDKETNRIVELFGAMISATKVYF